MRSVASVGIQRRASVPKPNMSAAFCTHVCVSAEQYIRSRPSAMPSERTSHGACARRAASTPMKFAMFPPLTSRPPQSGR